MVVLIPSVSHYFKSISVHFYNSAFLHHQYQDNYFLAQAKFSCQDSAASKTWKPRTRHLPLELQV